MTKNYYERNRKESHNKFQSKNKYIVLKYYSTTLIPSCSCCGERELDFLCLDHINGQGTKHRNETNLRGSKFYQWLISNRFPLEYELQVLCLNCNFSRRIRKGECIHKIKSVMRFDNE